ncbi:TadE/TadG family type IV pilus assembly protein [Pelagerythrobacter rhizovicinus]|uniref:Pilus assembly protein n=1 Tax=Pelagerythrobacter rhizovicinus TaxID=2268576 RepID=A0A4V1QWG5_9SPHN|nr:TadE/TadG family type IV pilus assembly protein [Pelagerythrobacter rhizovicinus]RXZ66076.1 pilus assembly protein [Pelagerythrobacter rhizovicinus]
MMKALSRSLRHFRGLAKARDGVALIEFAYSLPILVTLGFGGLELINYTMAHLRVNQIAISLADNASRAKQEVIGSDPRFRELDANESIRAAQLQGGNLDLEGNGRVILSSLEVNSDGGQWIHWQRCGGDKSYPSRYGEEGEGETGTSFAGMGTGSRLVEAEPRFAIMYAEVFYDYEPVIFRGLIPEQTIYKTAAMYVRDDRDLSDIFNPDPKAEESTC